jgi:hypothetical protein
MWRDKIKKITLAVLIVSLLVLPMSALALEKMSGTDLGGVVGQAGVTIAFGGTTTTRIDFSEISWGDPDGLAGTCGNAPGWLILDGDIIIDQIIDCGETLTLDIGTTGAGTCELPPCSVEVPGTTTFIAVGLPTTRLSITTPDTLVIGLGTAAGTITGTLGILNLYDLDITVGSPSTIYIWAH